MNDQYRNDTLVAESDLAVFNRGTSRAVRANRARPPELPRTIGCACGGMFATQQGLAVHRAMWCENNPARRTK